MMTEPVLCSAKAPVKDTLIISDTKRTATSDFPIYRIPLVFTVLYNTDEENALISDAVLNTQLQILNEDFRKLNPDRVNIIPQYQSISADAGIEFTLKEIRRVRTNVPVFTSAQHFDMYDPNKGGVAVVDPFHNCNIYFCNIDFAGGFSIFPEPGVVGSAIDANVIRIGSWASRPESSGYRIATHEIGHWLYLYHTFQSLCNPPGDKCNDTPPISSSTSGCPLDRKSCDGVTIANTQNHLDYSDCRIMFSNDQVLRMRSTLAGIRNALVTGNPNTLPVVRLKSPVAGLPTIPVGGSFVAEVEASDDTGIAKVEVYLNGSVAKVFTSTPYWIRFSRLTAGTYKVKAKAFDLNNQTAETPEVTVTVGGANTPPTVLLTSPTNGATFTAPASIILSATASDNVSVAKVEFYNGSTLLATDTTAPYSFTWNNVSVGNYILTAKAYDNLGASKISTAVNITVSNTVIDSPIVSSILKGDSKSVEMTSQDGRKILINVP